MKLRAHYLGFTALVVLLALYPLNLAFYAGATIGDLMWRLEHGRLQLRYSSSVGNESFYVAGNNETLRFEPEGRWESLTDWNVYVPLWLPILIVTILTVRSYARRRRSSN